MFDREGVFIRTLKPQDIKNFPPKFTERINGGYGQLTIDLQGDDWKFDDFSDGTDIQFFNYIQVYAVKVNPTTLVQTDTLIYGGFLTRYRAYIDRNSEEGIELTFLGWVSILSRSYFKDGTAYAVTKTTTDPKDILEDIIDHYNTIFGGSKLSYGANMSSLGTSVTVVYTDKKWLDAIKQTALLAGTNWWWKISASGEMYFKAKPGSATHKFTMKSDVIDISVTKDSEKVCNDVQVRYTGGGTYDEDDATSQEEFGFGTPTPSGKHSEIISETGLAVAAATLRGDKHVADNKDEKFATVATIGNDYDIESVHVGETCSFVNFEDGNPIFGTNMLITQVDYQGDFIKISLERTIGDFTLEMADLVS